MVMGLWPSRGLILHGIEVKVHRGDWLKELKQPEKAENVFGYCDRWWLCSTSGVAKLEEIPANWGWLECKGKRIYTRKDAPVLKPTKSMDKNFVAAMFRRLSESQAQMVPRSEISRELTERYNEGVEDGKGIVERERKYEKRQLDELRQAVKSFEDSSGLTLGGWSEPRQLGEIVRSIKQLGGIEAMDKRLRGLKEQAVNIAYLIGKALGEEAV